MASVERDSDANGGARGEEDNHSPVDSFASGDANVAGSRGYLGWPFAKDAKDESVLEPEKTEKYLVTNPKTQEGHRGPLKFCWDLLFYKGRWKQSCQISDPVQETVATNETWQARLSLLLLKFLWFVNKPFQEFGHWMEDVFNHFVANGGLTSTLYRTLFKRNERVLRQRESDDYLSISGVLDSRFALYADKSSFAAENNDDSKASIFPGTNYGSRSTADVLVMASKLAYENSNFVKKVVTQTWKMNFVAFYDCWNEFQQQRNTQVFLVTDQPKNAKAIIVAFRGTEPFNAIDWSTDMDFSWFEVKGLGTVHVGFLEALGLGDRNRMETFMIMRDNASSQQDIEHEGSAMSGLPADVVAEPTKVLAYDDVTKKVKQLMEENPEAKLFVTGHSLGGALANLYTTLLFFNHEEAVTSRLGALYTFGQPRVGGTQYCQFVNSQIPESKYWRIVYSNDLVPRVPFDDDIFQFKHAGYCYYYNEQYVERTLAEAPNANYFGLSFNNIILPRFVAIYELIVSLFSGWIYGPEFRENYSFIGVRLVGLVAPGVTAHIMNNYVNAIRLGPTPLEAKLQELEDPTKSLFSFISSFIGTQKVPATKDAHQS